MKRGLIKKLKNLLTEEFYTFLKPDYSNTLIPAKRIFSEIYKNPTINELYIILKQTPDQKTIRFIIDLDTGDEYVWNAMELIHNPVIKELGLKNYISGVHNLKKKFGSFDLNSCSIDDKKEIIEYFLNSNLFRKLKLKKPITVVPSVLSSEMVYFEKRD